VRLAEGASAIIVNLHILNSQQDSNSLFILPQAPFACQLYEFSAAE
jgi:hypothetical protein